MSSQAIFNDPIGIIAVILMVPVTFLWIERKPRGGDGVPVQPGAG